MAAGKSLLLKLMAQLGQVKVREVYLPKEDAAVVYGYTYADRSIAVNFVASVVDTLVHELLHSTYPDYSEATVRRLTRRLMHEMTDQEIMAFYDAYRARVDA
jgi:hypothetical protein